MRKTMNARAYRSLLMAQIKRSRTDCDVNHENGENLLNTFSAKSSIVSHKDVLDVADAYTTQTEEIREKDQTNVDAGEFNSNTEVHEGISTNITERGSLHLNDKKQPMNVTHETISAACQMVINSTETSHQSSIGPGRIIKHGGSDACTKEKLFFFEEDALQPTGTILEETPANKEIVGHVIRKPFNNSIIPANLHSQETSNLGTHSLLPSIANELSNKCVGCHDIKRLPLCMHNVDHSETPSLTEMHLKSESDGEKKLVYPELSVSQPENQLLVPEKEVSSTKHLNGSINESDLEEGEIRESSDACWSSEQQILRKPDHEVSIVVDVTMLNRSSDQPKNENWSSQIEEIASRRMKELLHKQTIEHKEFKSFMKNEKLKFEKTYMVKANLIDSTKIGNLCKLNQNSSCKMKVFDQYLKSQRKKLIVAQINARNREKQLKDKWMKFAYAGNQVKCFGTTPLSDSRFKPDCFREPYCQCNGHDFLGNVTENAYCSHQQSDTNNSSNNMPKSVPEEANVGNETPTVVINSTAADDNRTKVQLENIVVAASHKQSAESPSKLNTVSGCHSNANQEPFMGCREASLFDGVGREGQSFLSKVVNPEVQHTVSSDVIPSLAHQRPIMLDRIGNKELQESNSQAVIQKPHSVEIAPSGVEDREGLMSSQVIISSNIQQAHTLPVNEHEINIIPGQVINKEVRGRFQSVCGQAGDSILSVEYDGNSAYNKSVTTQIPRFIPFERSTPEHKSLTVSDRSGIQLVPAIGHERLPVSGGVAGKVSKCVIAQMGTEAECFDEHESCNVMDKVASEQPCLPVDVLTLQQTVTVPVTEQEKSMVSYDMGHEQTTKSMQLLISVHHSDGNTSFCESTSCHSLPSANVRSSVHYGGASISARKETSTKLFPSNDDSIILNPASSHSASLAVISVENGQTSAPQKEGSNYSIIIGSEPHSTENISIQVQESSNIDRSLDFTEMQSVEQGQTNSVSTVNNEQISLTENFNCTDYSTSACNDQNGDNTLQGVLNQLKSSTMLDPTQVQTSLYTTLLAEQGQTSPLTSMESEQISYTQIFKDTGRASSYAFNQDGNNNLEGLLNQISSNIILDPTLVQTTLHTGFSAELVQTNPNSGSEERASQSEMIDGTQCTTFFADNQSRDSILKVGHLDQLNNSMISTPSRIWTSLNTTLPVEQVPTNLTSAVGLEQISHTEMINGTAHFSSPVYGTKNDSTPQGVLDWLAPQAVISDQVTQTSAHVERSVNDPRCSGILQETRVHLTESVANTASSSTCSFDPDPLLVELHKIRKEEDMIFQMHNEMKMTLNATYEIEREKLLKKYVALFQESKAAYIAKKKSLDLVYEKLFMNRDLARNYVLNFFENTAAVSQGSTSPAVQAMQPQHTRRTTAASSITPSSNGDSGTPTSLLLHTNTASLPIQTQHPVFVQTSLNSLWPGQDFHRSSYVLPSNCETRQIGSLLSPNLKSTSAQLIQEVQPSATITPSINCSRPYSSTPSSSRTVTKAAHLSHSQTLRRIPGRSFRPSLMTDPIPSSASPSTCFNPETQILHATSPSILGQSSSSVLAQNRNSAGSMGRLPAPHLRGFTLPKASQ